MPLGEGDLVAVLSLDGVYTIRVAPLTEGPYELTFRFSEIALAAPDPATSDGGDGLVTSQTARIEFGVSIYGTLAAANEAQNWLFEGEAGQAVSISIAGRHFAQPVARLLDPGGREIMLVIAYDPEAPTIQSASLPIAGTYVIRVTTFTAGNVGEYVLTID